MGEEIQQSHFDAESFRQFYSRLEDETRQFGMHLASGQMDNRSWRCGFELEGWLLDQSLRPIPAYDRFTSLPHEAEVSPELAAFNIELNTPPFDLGGKVFSLAARKLLDLCTRCRSHAQALDIKLALIGTLPTLHPEDLSLDNISKSNRYAALNEQVFRQRKGRPLRIDIGGQEHLYVEHTNVMMESATTSFQVHLQTPIDQLADHYNASLIASAASIAVSANSPYLFGKQLWAETRIPLFEQAVDIGGYDGAVQGPLKRVSFGSGYVRTSILEPFQENLEHFPILLPALLEQPTTELAHMRFHNGTIWRWNRPLIGFESDGRLHARIEHRVMAAGPSVPDMIANTAFYIGLTHAMACQAKNFQARLPFATIKDNFYKAAKQGLNARIAWLNEAVVPIKQLILDSLLPLARAGLEQLSIDSDDADYYLDLIRQRILSGQTGARWQIEFAEQTGRDMRVLTDAYLQQQINEQPVHTWELPDARKQTGKPEPQYLDAYPEEFLTTPANQLYRLFDRSTLLSLQGHKKDAMFVSVLLHGNEDSGLIALQRILKKYHGKPLPRDLHIFIGNIEAARYGVRLLNWQNDYNRAWPGTELDKSDETQLLAEVYRHMQTVKPCISIDLHNNSGINPHYACINKLDARYMHLALLFSRTVVYFTRPRGVQSMALAELCPAVTVECGKPGDASGIERAQNFIDHCLNLDSLPMTPVDAQDIDLFHTVAQVRIPEKISFSFNGEPAHLNFSGDMEYMNFRELTAGTPWGDCAISDIQPLLVQNETGEDAYAEYFKLENGLLRLRKNVMPSMLTTNKYIIRQDCLCYLMERMAPP